MNRRQLFTQLSGMAAASTAMRGGEPQRADLPSREATDTCPPHVMGSLNDCPAWIRRWQQQPRYPVPESQHPLAARLLEAIHSGRSLEVLYFGGGHPGRSRRFTAGSLFRVGREDGAVLYVSGWCHERQAHRTLRLDKLTVREPQDPHGLKTARSEVVSSRTPTPHSAPFPISDTIFTCAKSRKPMK